MENFKIGDYVKYVGDYSTLEDIRRQPDYAKILDIKKFGNYWWVGVELLSSKQKISFSMHYLRPIPLEEKHLLKAGFEKVIIDSKPKFYNKSNIYISSIAISIIEINYCFISGFCLLESPDSFKNLDASYFIKDNEFNVQNFYDKYPNLYNLNSFIKLLVEKQLINDDEIQELVFLD